MAIVLVPFSSLFFLYLPACTCADLGVIAFLQGASHLLFKNAHSPTTHGWTAVKQEEDEEIWSEKSEDIPRLLRTPSGRARRLARTLAAYTLLLISILSVGVAVLAAGMYDAGRVVFRWEEALTFESTGQSSFLLSYAIENYVAFCSCWLSSFFGGIALTGSKLAVGRIFTSGGQPVVMRYTKQLLLGALTFATLYVVTSILVRPSSAVPASNLLLDGFTTAAMLAFSTSAGVTASHSFTAGLYGASNIRQPRVARLPPARAIKHVFYFFLESADGLAWPFSPEFCEKRFCQDIAPEYNNAEHMTPFFASLIQDRNTFFTSELKASVAYTTKSHFSSMCGQHPELKNFVHAEANSDPLLPCLPKLMRAFDPTFRSGFFTPHFFPFDGFGDTTVRTGYDLLFGKDDMDAGWKKQGVPLPGWSNLFGYSETELQPFVFDWIDEQLHNEKRIFMTHAGSVMHNDWNLPPSEGKEPFEYTKKSEPVNKYLNTVKYTDNHLKEFFAQLEKRGLLDNSLIVIQGDHGPRFDDKGVMNNERWIDSGIFKVPLLVRMPGLEYHEQPMQPLISLDMLPTVLDALEVDPRIVEQYVGHSIFRRRGPESRRHTFHAQIPGRHWVQVTFQDKDVSYKAIWINSDVCGTDIVRDPDEKYLYCLREGWRSTNVDGKMLNGVTAGLWKTGEDQDRFIQWMKEAEGLLEKHSVLNAEEWTAALAENRTINQEEVLSQVSKYSIAF